MKGERPILTRRQRFFRYALRLVASLLLLCIGLDFPIPTAELARRATERRNYFGPSEVLCTLEEPISWDRSYAIRWDDWYGVVSIRRAGLFWDTGRVDIVKNDPDLPLIPLEDRCRLFQNEPVVVFSNDPTIVSVTLEFPAQPEGGEIQMISATQDEGENGCFSIFLPPRDGNIWTYSQRFRLSGYDADGELVWRSPTPTGGNGGWDYLFGPDVLDL